jgi:signal transduction histidine kinase
MDRTTMTTDTTPTYWRYWRGVPRELLYLLIAYPLGLAAFITTITLVSTGVGTLITFFIGVLAMLGALLIARGFGTLELILLEWTGQPRIERPSFAQRETGLWGWLKAVFANGHYWLYLLHSMIVNFVVTLVTWTITITALGIIANGLSYWFWARFLPADESNWRISAWLFGQDVASTGLDAFLYFLLALVFIAILPFITHGFTSFHHLVARGLLGAFKSDALRAQVGSLTAAGAAASSAEGHSLRRLERDIHDGPQQRLVRLQMDLAAAERQLETDPEKAKALITEAMDQSKEALEELRALSRGFAPPILLDRGLVAAIESAAVRSTIPTRVIDELDGIDVPQELERNAYFVASEALANAAKHSDASDIEVRVSTKSTAATDATWLVITVTDDGRGGAAISEGHGLAGLEQRVRGLGGVLEIASPDGGPTIVTADFPLTPGS